MVPVTEQTCAKSVVLCNKIIIVVIIIFAVAGELEQLLVKQSSLEVYFEWLDSLIERKVCEVRLVFFLKKTAL